MPRGMDDTFHRLLWVTLVAVAFTFTVILTSVFVDIDDLLANRTPIMKQQIVTEATLTELPVPLAGDLQEFTSTEEDTNENESTFRTKRSLDSNNYLLQIKSPKAKKILTSRLASLLEELDEEESSKATNTERGKNTASPKYLSTEENVQNTESIQNVKHTNINKLTNDIEHEDLLHLAMHNILLEGIIGHMDLNEVYKKVHLLLKSLETNPDRDIEEISEYKLNKSKSTELLRIISHDSHKEGDIFLNELMKCEKLQNQILQTQNIKDTKKQELYKDPQMLIKTTIEIININKRKEQVQNSNENTTRSLKIVYNGKEIKANDMIVDKNIATEVVGNTQIAENQHKMKFTDKKEETEQQNMNESALNKAIADYLTTHSLKFHNKFNIMAKGSYLSKRLKRQIKIRYLDDQVTTEKSKRSKEKSKHHDDDLYVEIETHFDGKGTKGEKKKKLVRTLIDKIQKAINSNVEVLDQEKSAQRKRIQIKKRIQNPIDHNELIVNTKSPIDVIEQRQLNPISKTANIIKPLTSVLDKSGDTWKKIYNGPGFLTAKSLNSAEMRELEIDYNSVMKNGIPKRLQKPINTENEDLTKPNEFTNIGNFTLFLKDINDSGFSIGINQYVDEPPDKETLKIFSGLENLIQAYHEDYDQTETINNGSDETLHYFPDTNHEIRRRDVTNQKPLSKKWFSVYRNLDKQKEQGKQLLDFTQNSPYKRSAINVNLFSNIKSKTKISKFINTNARVRKKIFHKIKRNKRQLDKIRIIASDRYPSTSSEDVFLVSRENIYADRAIIKEGETPEVEVGDRNEEHYDLIAPYSYNLNNPNFPAYLSTTYNTESLDTGLMSKYPHIFLEKISRSKDFTNVSPPPMEEKIDQNLNPKKIVHVINDNESDEKNISSTNVDDIVNAILPSRNNFKVVLKIFPKTNSTLGPSFKEVHTLINKSYDKNGVRYVSSLNVSELSKVESLNTTKEGNLHTVNQSEMEHQQNQIKLLLELHKQRIDQQLRHLRMESQKLNEMIGHENSNKNISQLIDLLRQTNLKSPYVTNDVNTHKHVTTVSDTLVVKSETTTKSLFTTINNQEDVEKMKIISSMNESQNITRAILQKIDKNTNMLETFLKKLIDEKKTAPAVVINAEKILSNDTPNFIAGDQMLKPILQQVHATNFTNTVPFIYAFQHPLIENNNKPKTVAHVVYHGHIHTDKLKNDGNSNDFVKRVTNNLKIENNKKLNNIRAGNDSETRFFIDELENDFKLVSSIHDRIPILTHVKTNTTKT